jgi:hypothetical protein
MHGIMKITLKKTPTQIINNQYFINIIISLALPATHGLF